VRGLRITILTWGTRGDVQPYVALAAELEKGAHRVRLAVNENHLAWVRRTGVEVAALPFDFRSFMTSEAARGWFERADLSRFLAALAEQEHAKRHAIFDAMMDVCGDADAIVSGLHAGHRAAAIAEARGIAFARAFNFPIEPTAAYPSPYLGNCMPPLARGELRLRSHRLGLSILHRGQRADLDEARRRLGLPAVDDAEEDLARREASTVHLFDERVLPRPDDWPASVVIGGYCPLPPEVRARLGEVIDEELDAWLDAGPPPIFFSFGSIPLRDPPAFLGLVRRVCREIGARALVSAGWSDLRRDAGDEVRVVGAVDHDAVLPRCAVAVHHGGAGTTGATLAAGIPAVVCSVTYDQPLWGWRVESLGVGATLPAQRLTAERLLAALRVALDDEVAERARALGAELRATDGRKRVVEALLPALAAPLAH
jgi:sterol 3beta-glucosyltransferase